MPHDLEMSPPQLRAIKHDRGFLRIIACPGSGKTETVSRRAAELIRNGARPSGIIAFTFTVKAAEELRSRIRSLLDPDRHDLGDMFIGTIDSFCLHMLKKARPEYRSFDVLDEAKRLAFVNRHYHEIGIGELGKGRQYTVRKFCDSANLMLTERIDPALLSDRIFARCYESYLQKLKEERLFDFASVIRTLLDIFGDRDAPDGIGDGVDHVIFDEYQDVNLLQEELLALLSKKALSVCVVGDDDQNIFQWRGSDNRHITEFDKRYGDTTTEVLDINYRATVPLVRTAAEFIAGNASRQEKGMRASPGQRNRFEHGDMVHRHFETDAEEFRFVCDSMQDLLGTEFYDRSGSKRPLSYGDMAVIVRTNGDAARITAALGQRGIPCVADSGTDVFRRPIVSLALDCIMYSFGCPGYTASALDGADLKGRYQKEVPGGDAGSFAAGLERIRKRAHGISSGRRDWLPDLGLQEFYQRVLVAMGAERGSLTGGDMESLAVLSAAISDYEYVHRFLRARDVGGLKWFISLFAARLYRDPAHRDGDGGAVRVMTIWKAKGLEFPAVFIPSFHNVGRHSSGTFVDRSLYPHDRYDGGEEAERRAYYTAITRAQKHLYLTSAKATTNASTGKTSVREKTPHRFLDSMNAGMFSGIRTRRPKMAQREVAGRAGPVSATYSDLSVYGRCPHDYYLRRVLGFSEGIPAAFGYGTAIHNVINRIHSDYIKNKRVPDPGAVEEVFDEIFYLRFASPTHAKNLRQKGLAAVKRYVLLYGGEFDRILATENRFEFRLDGAMVSGSIDLIRSKEDGAEIVDFKTGGGETYGQDNAGQVRFYAYAARKSLGHSPRGGAVHNLDTGAVDPVETGEDALCVAEAKTLRMTRDIAAERFEADPEKSKCQGCDFRAICPHKGFELGVDFKAARSRRRSSSEPVPQASDTAVQRARVPADIEPNGDGTYSVRSLSDPGKRYVVTEDRCECLGFRYSRRYNPVPTCSHVEAVRTFLDDNQG